MAESRHQARRCAPDGGLAGARLRRDDRDVEPVAVRIMALGPLPGQEVVLELAERRRSLAGSKGPQIDEMGTTGRGCRRPRSSRCGTLPGRRRPGSPSSPVHAPLARRAGPPGSGSSIATAASRRRRSWSRTPAPRNWVRRTRRAPAPSRPGPIRRCGCRSTPPTDGPVRRISRWVASDVFTVPSEASTICTPAGAHQSVRISWAKTLFRSRTTSTSTGFGFGLGFGVGVGSASVRRSRRASASPGWPSEPGSAPRFPAAAR